MTGHLGCMNATSTAAQLAYFFRARIVGALDTADPRRWRLAESVCAAFPVRRAIDLLGSGEAATRWLSAVEVMSWGASHRSDFFELFGIDWDRSWSDWGCDAANTSPSAAVDPQ